MPQSVQCSKCGYLSVRNKETGELESIEFETRTEGQFPRRADECMGLGVTTVVHSLRPICFRLEPVMMAQSKGAVEDVTLFFSIINENRECARFVEWTPQFGPKEHFQMDFIERQIDRQERQERVQRWMHVFELFIIGVIVPAVMIIAQVITTQMQVKATMKAAMQLQPKSP